MNRMPLRFLALCALSLPLTTACASDGGGGGGNRFTSGPLTPVHLVTALDELAGQAAPDGDPADREKWGRYSEWLGEIRGEVEALRAKFEADRNANPTGFEPFATSATFTELANRVRLQARRYDPMSEALRARHDAVLDAFDRVE